MKKFITLLFSSVMTCTLAGPPSYVVLGQNKIDECQGTCVAKAKSLDERMDFTLSSMKSLDRILKVKMVHLGSQSFPITMQDEFSLEEGVPFFEVQFPKGLGIAQKIYGLKATSGTSGMSFHYFIKSPEGAYSYSGMHPEIIFDDDLAQFISVEKDGMRAHVTTWKLEKSGFKVQSQEVVE